MVFSSIPFLFYFLPVLIVIYCIVPRKFKNAVMIAASMVFFAWGEIRFIPIMLALTVVDFVCGQMMEKNRENDKRRRLFMLIGVITNLVVLIYFKYVNFFATGINSLLGTSFDPNIILPIGVSFNSFQSMSYAIDVYRGTTKAEKKYYDYLHYTTLFPQVIAGPIVRYVTVEQDLDSHTVTLDGFSKGFRRFIAGLAKKVLIADTTGFLWDQVMSGNAGQPSVLLYWLGIIAFTFQIYFDFSGYSDMAIGLAQVFGLTFDENFDAPYISRSITEFWRRWHITLGAWFRDYVYIPLGGNRKGFARQILNIFIVWALTGFWHGANFNFVIWGLYFAIFLAAEKFFLLKWLDKIPRLLQHVYTMLVVIVGWVIFSGDDLLLKGNLTVSSYLAGMFGLAGIPFADSQAAFYLVEYLFLFLVAIYFSTPHFKTLLGKIELTQSKTKWSVYTVSYILIFLVCVAFLLSSSYSPFLYFRF